MKTRARSLLFITGCIGMTQTPAQTTALDVVNAMHEGVMRHTSCSYTADLQMKYSNLPEMYSYVEHVKLQRTASDSLFGGMIHFTQGDSAWTFTDGESVYVCDQKKNTAIWWPPTTHPAARRWPIDQDARSFVIWRAFLQPERIEDLKSRTVLLQLMPDTVIDGTACWHLRSVESDRGEVTQVTDERFVSKTHGVPVLSISRKLVQGDLQYASMHISDLVFDSLDPSEFLPEFAAKGMVFSDFAVDADDTEDLLPSGSLAPPLIGDLYGSDAAPDTISLTGKVTFIDFWYMHCPPCIGSIPALDSLARHYESRGVQFIGVNRWDNTEARLDRLPKFLVNHPIHYPILLDDGSIETAYAVRPHPTFYLVDRTGVIRYGSTGYGKGIERHWGEAIEALLK